MWCALDEHCAHRMDNNSCYRPRILGSLLLYIGVYILYILPVYEYDNLFCFVM